MRLYGVILFVAFAASAAAAEAPPRELVTYIQDAKKLGLTDEQIRRNTAAAGWAPAIVDEALAANSGGASAAPQAQAGLSLPADYRIGIGDVLQISVWREPEASVPTAVVRADGKITLPLIKDVDVAGMAPAEAERMLGQRLSRFIHSADVAVIVKEVNSRKVYLVGALKTVGAIDLKSEITVLQAITQSGGLTDYAKRKQIYVMRNENGKQVKLPFNYEAVIRGENMEQNIRLRPNDTIVVP